MGDSSNEMFSSWSRMKLCWLPSDWVQEISGPINRVTRISLIDLDDRTSGIHVAKITWGPFNQYILLERRGSNGYILFADETKDSGKGILTYNGALHSYQFAPEVALDETHGFSAILLDNTLFKVAIASVQVGKTAREAATILNNANVATSRAYDDNRLQGLDEAKSTLQQAYQAYSNEDFERARQLAYLAATKAGTSTTPQSYYDATQLINLLDGQLKNATFKTKEAQSLRDQAASLYTNATVKLDFKRFDEAKTLAQQGLSLLQEAREKERVQLIVGGIQFLLPGLVAGIGISVILFQVLRKRKRAV